MTKKKNKKNKKDKKVKVEIAQIERKGKCLRCGKSLVKNHDTCVTCRKKIRLQRKANQRGKRKNYYLK